MTACTIFFIRVWQKFFSSEHAPFGVQAFGQCRFVPSCSEYALGAVRQYGLYRGLMFSLWRILRCNPLSKGGHDPVG